MRRIRGGPADNALQKMARPAAAPIIGGEWRGAPRSAFRARPASGRRRTGSARPCSTGSRRSWRAAAAWTCSPAAARWGSRRCRAAPPPRPSSSATGRPRTRLRETVAAAGARARAGRPGRRAPLARRARRRRFDIVFLDPPFESGLLGRARCGDSNPAAGWRPSAYIYLEAPARRWRTRAARRAGCLHRSGQGRGGRLSSGAAPGSRGRPRESETQRRLSGHLRSDHQRPPGPRAPRGRHLRPRRRRHRRESLQDAAVFAGRARRPRATRASPT